MNRHDRNQANLVMEIPTVSINSIGLASDRPEHEDFLDIGNKLDKAFSEYGFVYLTDHGIDQQIVQDMFEASKSFFTLSANQKLTCSRHPITTQGYVRPGQEMLDNLKEGGEKPAFHEIRESFDVVSLEPSARFPDDLVPEMRSAFVALGERLLSLSFRILEALALGLGLNPKFFVDCHQLMIQKANSSKLRSLYYPAILGNDRDLIMKGVVRCGEHSDYGTITFLFQDDLGGLEIKGPDGSWIQAPPNQGSILAKIFTNGKFPATRHRVVIPEEEIRRRQPRQSFVYFIHPDDSTLVKPILDEEPKLEKYQGINALQHLVNQFSATYR
eukprot:TCALIF_06288-PA protein Name:"Similar to DDB_G0283291 Probable iron/ascorbate oxidoreductase DDB_G0283291 (Dictyostelium discoideum)" AED:0.34 eAED:0.34 QI:0/0.4/0.16/1/0.4/0.5/6/0/328